MNAADPMGNAASDARRSPARVAVIGGGPLADEIVRNLGLVGIPAALHPEEDFWGTLRLADLQDCYCAVAAGIGPAARRRLNALCQVASVDLVCVTTGANGVSIETFPFGSDPGCACFECEAPVEGSELPVPVPDPIATSIAGALAAATALHCAGQGARRLFMPEVTEASTLVPLLRRANCEACAPPWRAPRIIRTRNRWAARNLPEPEAPALAAQTVRLSDAVVTTCECARCGPVAALADPVSAARSGAPVPPSCCPICGSAPLRIETRATFTLGELTQRFGRAPVPAKFALAEIGGMAVCFDLEGSARDAGGAP